MQGGGVWFYFNEKQWLWKLWGFRKLLPAPSSPSWGLGEREWGAPPQQWVLSVGGGSRASSGTPWVLQRAPDAPKGSRGSQGFGGLSGAPVALRILEGPRGLGCSSGPHMSWRDVPRSLGCSWESGVFPRVWGAQQALGCSEGLPQGSGSEHPRMLWSPQDTAKLRDALRIPRCSKAPKSLRMLHDPCPWNVPKLLGVLLGVL